MTINIPICFNCKNYINDYMCKAFNDGIPPKILTGNHDHRKPYPGDNGIQFEPIKDANKSNA